MLRAQLKILNLKRHFWVASSYISASIQAWLFTICF